MKEHIEKNGLPDFHTSAEALQDMVLYKAYSMAMNSLVQEVEKVNCSICITLF